MPGGSRKGRLIYQPRSRSVLKARVRILSAEKRRAFSRLQSILQRERDMVRYEKIQETTSALVRGRTASGPSPRA